VPSNVLSVVWQFYQNWFPGSLLFLWLTEKALFCNHHLVLFAEYDWPWDKPVALTVNDLQLKFNTHTGPIISIKMKHK
jgi:hypothetical protein